MSAGTIINAAMTQTCFDFQKSFFSVNNTNAIAAPPTKNAITIFTNVAKPRKMPARIAHFHVSFLDARLPFCPMQEQAPALQRIQTNDKENKYR